MVFTETQLWLWLGESSSLDRKSSSRFNGESTRFLQKRRKWSRKWCHDGDECVDVGVSSCHPRVGYATRKIHNVSHGNPRELERNSTLDWHLTWLDLNLSKLLIKLTHNLRTLPRHQPPPSFRAVIPEKTFLSIWLYAVFNLYQRALIKSRKFKATKAEILSSRVCFRQQ